MPAPHPSPAAPKQLARPDAPVTMAQLDARLVSALGLRDAAGEFAAGAPAAGLKIPARFGTEVVARLLGLRSNHPASEDALELLPNDPATRAEAAYSAAQVLHFDDWEVSSVQSLADAFACPSSATGRSGSSTTAVGRIGMPYIWGGTSDGPQTAFGVTSRGGYDCSGFVWRVYKLQPYADEGDLASVLRGRTTYDMSGEVPRSQRVGFAGLQPADVIFFGDRGPRSQPSQVGHMGIYSATVGSSTPPVTGSRSRHSTAGTSASSRGRDVRSRRPVSPLRGISAADATITPSGDFTEACLSQTFPVWRPSSLEEKCSSGNPV